MLAAGMEVALFSHFGQAMQCRVYLSTSYLLRCMHDMMAFFRIHFGTCYDYEAEDKDRQDPLSEKWHR